MTWSRIAATAALAGLAIALVATHVFTEFTGIRVKAVRQPVPASGRDLRVPVDDERLLGLQAPFAVIARIENGGDSAQDFSVALDGAGVCTRRVDSRSSRRVDCVITTEVPSARAHEVVVSSAARPWTLEYLELATHHGGTIGAHELVILPASSEMFRRPGAARLAIVWVLLTAILLVPSPTRMPRWLSFLYKTVAGILLALIAGCLVSQWVSPYRVIVSAKTMTAWLLILTVPRLWILGTSALRRPSAQTGIRIRVVRASVIAVLACSVYAAFVAGRLRTQYHGNFSGFLQISRQHFDKNPLLNSRDDVRRSLIFNEGGGYDGQFMYFATFDPFLRAFRDRPQMYAEIMDAVPYRYGRIGFSLLTRVFSAGRWERYPATMMALILVSLAALAFVLALLAQERWMTPAWGLLVVIVPGFWESLQTGLPEPVAAAALVGGVACLWHRRWVAAGLLFGVSLLVRETGLVAVVAVLAGAAINGRRRQAMLTGGLALGALLLWRIYLASILYSHWGTEAFLFHPPDLGAPFAGFIDLWHAIASGTYYPGFRALARAGVAYPILLIGALGMAAALLSFAPTALSVAAVFYGVLAVCLNYSAIWVHVGNGQRGTYEVFLMLALASVILPAERQRLRLALLTFWAACACYVFFLGFDATDIRGALPLPF